jgi:hypothetical protein
MLVGEEEKERPNICAKLQKSIRWYLPLPGLTVVVGLVKMKVKKAGSDFSKGVFSE